jgi:hypothetical protein
VRERGRGRRDPPGRHRRIQAASVLQGGPQLPTASRGGRWHPVGNETGIGTDGWPGSGLHGWIKRDVFL